MFWRSRYIKQLELQIKVLENEIHRITDRSNNEREKHQVREAKLIDRLLAKHGVPEVDLNLKEPRDINNMAIFEDIEAAPRQPEAEAGAEDILDERKGARLDAFAG